MSEEMQAKRERAYAALERMDINTTFDACGDEGEWSAGAEWCDTVYVSAREAWDAERFDHESDNSDSDVASEVADALTPVYTHNRWLIFVDLCAYWSERAEESASRGGTMTDMAGGVLYDLANDAIMGLVEEWRGELPEEEEEEEEEDVTLSDADLKATDHDVTTVADDAPRSEPCCVHCHKDCEGGHSSDTCGHCSDSCC